MKLSEAEQRTVYEWLDEDDLRGRDWKLMSCVDKKGKPTAPVAQYEAGGRTFAKPLPPLDMNTWHEEVMPKLAAQGIKVQMSIAGMWYVVPPFLKGAVTRDTDPWAALLQYIKAVRP